MKLWHCRDARSLRPLWTLEELQLPFELELVAFPPRTAQPGFTQLNPLGTLPYFTDGPTQMTESSAICLYLAQRYGEQTLSVEADHPEYGSYLNWLFHSDATLTFPQTVYLRYARFETAHPGKQDAGEDYRKWFGARLKLLNQHLPGRRYLCAERFTVADICVGFALFLADKLGIDERFTSETRDYLQRITARPAFQRAIAHTAHLRSPLEPGP